MYQNEIPVLDALLSEHLAWLCGEGPPLATERVEELPPGTRAALERALQQLNVLWTVCSPSKQVATSKLGPE